ncbi:MAG TPA: efflux RND transporter periplasmic adaptor subunit [Aromatoleum sp.]|uniref:efflux RND transporter periplasmic adaptor subunit n=1 Tax=Aromatoleum sp. TaxID=2307007 RepID=UPI002B4A96E7|nr:efflux RND transporter periplasmic adaptor subunit [Aromatoleum sp.]HJV28823.1 efflux RND transporter periplasmic adaptor subunit [Aromatoleum sp.]
MTRSRMLVAAVVAVAAVGGGYWYYTSRVASAPVAAKAPPLVPVTAAVAAVSDVPVLLEVIGRAEAYESVTVKSRLDGQVASVVYTEGQHVRQGDVLLRLDPADYEARLRQAEANVAGDEAQVAKARADVERYVALKGRGFVSDEKVNEVHTDEAAAQATVKADKAAVEFARLQLSYTTVRAPFDGVVGARLVFPGSAVKVNDTALAVVNRVKPLFVSFDVSEKHLPRLREAMAAGRMKAAIKVPGGGDPPVEGIVRFLDNAVDTTTGTIQMKAVLDNQDEKLLPGQFVNISLRLATLGGAIVVPTEAVQQGPDGNFLYVIGEEDKVAPRKVEVETMFEGRAAIAKGLAAGEKVVTDGQLRLTPGARVKVKGEGADASGKAAGQPAPAAAEPTASRN